MILLGIDPGSRFAGFSVLHKKDRGAILLDYGCLRMDPKKPLAERVTIFHDFFKNKIIQHSITDIALETPFLGKNAQNFLKLGYLRGIVYLLSHTHGIKLHEYSPREVKQAVTGFGGASKDQIANAILRFFPRIKTFETQDVSDALAVTLCGLWNPQKTL